MSSNNMLTQKQMFTLSNWLVKNVEICKGKNMQQAAIMASVYLKFPVTSANIMSARDITELDLFRVGQADRSANPRDRLSIVAKHLIDLMKELGKEIPEDLLSVAQRRKEKEQS